MGHYDDAYEYDRLKDEKMTRDIYAHVPPFGEAKVWSEEESRKEKQGGQMQEVKPAGISIAPEFSKRYVEIKQVRLNGWYSREDLIKILAMKEMQ